MEVVAVVDPALAVVLLLLLLLLLLMLLLEQATVLAWVLLVEATQLVTDWVFGK